ncbi:MAG: hypothetical protein KDB00_29315 [Planctomycetales bacterium]|nr:hypothetical protein [Planctomycetales bacterium]
MSIPNSAAPSSTAEFPPASLGPMVGGQHSVPGQRQLTDGHSSDDRNAHNGEGAFVDRRRERTGQGSSERRQFGSSHEGLSEAGRELALAIDQYKLQHHRRYITCDEMLLVITRLGYSK